MQARVGALSSVIAGGVTLWIGRNAIFTVDGGHRGIVYNRVVGIKEKVLAEGTHVCIPWIERPIIYDVRSRPNLMQSTSGSRDLQMVNISLRVLSRPRADALPNIYRTLGTDWDERVLPSIIQETLKSIVAKYNVAELLTKREIVSREIRRVLEQRAMQFNILLDDVSITQLNFGKEYTKAVEDKQVAQQEAERAKFVVQKALEDKKSAVIRAEGEAKSARLLGEAIRHNPAFVHLRKIEAAREIASTVANSQNRVYLNAENLLLSLDKMELTTNKGTAKF
mmetsp:Transcript_1206/g.3996  ORF Transcript_1206/g.3996 Transcript_1206/m.3996 type:complete len:281 (+) Transcript_1206:249-1091(+)